MFKNIFKYSKRLVLYQIATCALCLMVVPMMFLFSKENMSTALLAFSVFMLIYLCFLDFLHANKIGVKERANPKIYTVNAMKGFFMGLIAQLPMWIITMVLFFNRESLFNPFSEYFRGLLSNIFTLQYISILGNMNFSAISYIISMVIVPVICGLGYLLGAKGFSIEEKFGTVNKD